ncbi:hypothetical protein D3C87_1920030 [compost metagenome]
MGVIYKIEGGLHRKHGFVARMQGQLAQASGQECKPGSLALPKQTRQTVGIFPDILG